MMQSVPKATAARRLANVRTLAGRYETQVDLAVATGLTKSGLNQLIGPNPLRPISDRMARKLEQRLRLAPGTLDSESPAIPPSAVDQAAQVIDAVMQAADEAVKGLNLTAEKYRILISALYRSALRNGGRVDPQDVGALVTLVGPS